MARRLQARARPSDRRDRDTAARSFAVAFYRALGNRRSVKNAVEHAVATLRVSPLASQPSWSQNRRPRALPTRSHNETPGTRAQLA
jgi:hypothetical protein